MGEVWRARDTRLGRDVAVKVLPDEVATDTRALARFEHEAKAVAALSHPNILALFDVGEAGGVRYAVAELLDGETLRAALDRGLLPRKRALEIAGQVASALAAAHEKGIVHRDIKPENVFLTRDGSVKVLDFGIARQRPPAAPADTVTPTFTAVSEPGAIFGTVAYMSPEQARGTIVDFRSDQFSLGIVLYEMLAGRRPFKGASTAETLTAIIREEPEPLSNGEQATPAPVRWLVERCLAKEARERYTSTEDLARELRTLSLHMSEAGFASSSTSAVPGAPPRRRAGLVASGIAVAAAALAGAFWLGHAGARESRPRAGPVPQLVRLTWEPSVKAWPSISPDGGSFVYQAGPDGNRQIFLRRVRGENPVNLTKEFAGDNYTPAFSPDGRSIAFRSERDGGGIFVMGATGESPRRLTAFGYEPAWSPDGRSIAVAMRNSIGGGPAGPINAAGLDDLRIVDVATGVQRKVFEGHGRHPAWSPSGARIAFDQRVSGRHTLATVPVSGGVPTTVLDLPTSLPPMPSWTRGGIWFLSSAGGIYNIWRVELDEATGRRTKEAEQVLNGAGSAFPRATADGRKLVFTMGSRTNMIERYDFDVDRGTLAPEAHPVLTGPRNFIPQAVSPDGEWLATLLFEDEGRQDILLIRVRTGETRRLTDDALREDSLEWAPDGSKLYFSAAPGGAGEVWSIRPDGSGREREVASEGLVRITAPLASPDGRTLLVEVGPDIQPHLVDLGVPLAQRKLVPLPPLPTGKIFEAWAWSPDGRWIAGYSYSPVDGRRPPLYLFDTQRRTFEELADLKSTPLWPDWLPDSRRLLVRRGEKVEVLDRVTRTLKPAGSLRPDVQRVLLSRDGRSLFGTRWVVESDVWMLDYGAAP